jgi:hypothetical protein
MASEISTINKTLDDMRKKELELIKRREALLVEEAVRYTEEAQPSAAMQVARALIAVYTESDVSLEILFGVQSADVNTAGLLLQAEYRNPETIQMFLNNGADVIARDKQGFSVLEMVLQGHDGYWRGDSPHWNKAVFDILAKYVNLDYQDVKPWIIEQCCTGAPKYVRDFLGLDV